MARGHCEFWIPEYKPKDEIDLHADELYELMIYTINLYIDHRGTPDIHLQFIDEDGRHVDLQDFESIVNGKKIRKYTFYDGYEFGLGKRSIEDTKDGEVLCHVSDIKEDRLKPDILIIGNEIISFPEIGYDCRFALSQHYVDKKDYKELDELMTNRLLELKNSGKGYLVTVIYHF